MLRLTVIGNIGKDAVLREANNLYAIGFSVAVNEKYKNKEGVEVEKTTWTNCTIWRAKDKSTKITEFLKAGTQVFVEGTPSVRTYEKDSKTFATIELRVDNVQLLGGKKESSSATATAEAKTEEAPY